MSLTKVTYSMISGPVVNPRDYGAVGDGITDDTVAIQAAVNAGSVIIFETVTYKIAGTILVPSNRWFQGAPGTEFLGIMTPEGGGIGGYPNQMFRNADTVNGNANIAFSNIKFNFAKGNFNYVVGPNLTTINSLLFVLVDNMAFENCELFDFVTNLNNTLTMRQTLQFGVAQFDRCTRVSFQNLGKKAQLFTSVRQSALLTGGLTAVRQSTHLPTSVFTIPMGLLFAMRESHTQAVL